MWMFKFLFYFKDQRSPSSVPKQKKKCEKKFQRSSFSVPKQRHYFKGVPQGCLNKKKRSKKKFQRSPSSVPKPKNGCKKKKVQILFHPLF
jgi:hypothetical protein